MAQDHYRADGDRLLGARLSGIALRHARWGGLTAAEKAAGTAELTEVAGDRGDLLAEVAGLMLGSATGRGPEYEARGQAVPDGWRRRGADPAVDRRGPPPRRGRSAATVQPAGPCTTQTLNTSGLAGQWRGPRPPHGAYAATISNGLCDHTRAIPRPVHQITGTSRRNRGASRPGRWLEGCPPSRRSAAVVIEPCMCPCCGGERPDPG